MLAAQLCFELNANHNMLIFANMLKFSRYDVYCVHNLI